MSGNHNQTQKKLFHNYHSLDLQNKVYQQKALSLAIKVSKNKKSIQLVELGCADKSFLNLVCKKIKAKGQGMDISLGDDFEKPLKLKNNSLDLLIALEVIEHLYDTDHFLQEINRSLKSKGYLIISTPNLASLGNRFKLLFGGYPKYLEFSREGAGHIHLYTPNVLINQLKQSGFKIKLFTSPNFFCPFITKPWFPPILRQFFMFLGDLFPTTGSHLLVLAQKP